jgi:hypothetical protein
VQTCHYKMCMWRHHDHFPFSQNHSCNSCALAIAFGSDKQSKSCRTHRVVVIAMKSKGNNNKPILKVVTTITLQPPKRYHSAARPRHNSFASSKTRAAAKYVTNTTFIFAEIFRY